MDQDDIDIPPEPGSPTPVRINNRNVRLDRGSGRPPPPAPPRFVPSPPPSSSSSSSSPPRKRRQTYGDRYIPNRAGMNLHAAYSLVKDDVASSGPSRPPAGRELDFQKIQEANKTFSTLLKAELFANDVPMAVPVSADGPSSSSSAAAAAAAAATRDNGGSLTPPRSSASAPVTPNKNLFRYQSPTKYSTTGPLPRTSPWRDVTDPQHDIYSISPVRMDSQRLLLSPRKPTRMVSKVPYKVLDAPELEDDFYLNLVDWGSKNVLAVGLRNAVYLWNGGSGQVKKLCQLDGTDKVTSVSWIQRGTHLALGTSTGMVQIWDAEKCQRVRQMTGHDARTDALAWNESVLSSASKDRSILHRDVRQPEHFFRRLTGHRQEVCGLKWNIEENKLASGSNDNNLIIWDGFDDTPLYKFEHDAAVKAMSWSPHQRGLLASGAGSMDRRIRFWSMADGSLVNEVDTGSQVCNLAWSKNSNELVSTHGYSQNQVMVWKYPSMQQVAALTGHTYRVLYLAVSPDGRTIVTGAGDETLRFWNVFSESKGGLRGGSVLDAFQQIR